MVISNTRFLLALFFCPILAFLWPQLGDTTSSIPVTPITMILTAAIFFLNGLTLETQTLGNAIRDWRLITAMQSYCFIAVPIVTLFVTRTLFTHFKLPEEFVIGTWIIGCLPTTLVSCTLFTKTAGGNTEGSMMNAIISLLLGILITPYLLSSIMQTERPDLSFSIQWTTGTLIILILCPLTAGQAIRKHVYQSYIRYVPDIIRIFLLLIVFSLFCSAAAQAKAISLSIDGMITLIALMFLLQILFLFGAALSGLFFPERKDRIALFFTASEKTLAAALPLVASLLSNQPFINKEFTFGLMLLPLLLFYLIQWLTATLIIKLPLLSKRFF